MCIMLMCMAIDNLSWYQFECPYVLPEIDTNLRFQEYINVLTQ